MRQGSKAAIATGLFAAFTGDARAQECARAPYAWCSGYPYYFNVESLPLVDGTSCCGSELLGDPSVGDAGRTCLCDVTAGACDEGCCCDTDCSYDSLRHDGVFGCLSNGTAVAARGFTVCSENLVSTNIPAYAQEEGLATALGGADGLLCVFSDNSPARGAYFRDPLAASTLTPQAVIAQMDAAKPLQYGTSWLATSTDVPASTYTLDAPLLGDGCVHAGGDATGCSRRAPVALPAPDAAGGCTGATQLAYLRDVPPYPCPLLPAGAPTTGESRKSLLRSLCGGALNSTLLNAATIATAPSTAAEMVGVGIQVQTRVNGSSVSAFSAAGENGLAGSTYSDAVAGGTCYGALVKLELKVTVSGEGRVVGATAYVTLEDVYAANLPTLAPTFAAAFVYESDEASESSVVTRPTSGRPGYVRGLPLLVAEGSSVRTGGIDLLPRSRRGLCGGVSQGAAASVKFGEDLMVSCTTSLSAGELASMCSAGTVLSQQAAFLNINVSDATKLGVFGDSHPNLVGDWVALSLRWPQNEPDTAMAWNADTATCDNVLSGIHLRVLYAEVGSVALPVNKVVGAELLLSSRSVSASKGALLGNGAEGAGGATTLVVSATATFAKLDADTFEFIPESPQLIPPLPYDFFYPFTTSYL